MTSLGAHTASELESLDQIHICLPLYFNRYIKLSGLLIVQVKYITELLRGPDRGHISGAILQFLIQLVWAVPC